VQYRSLSKPFDRREPARYGRPAVVPDSSETLNIDSDTESQFEALLVKQRIMPRTANWYYLLLGNRLASDRHAHAQPQNVAVLTSCNSLDRHGYLDDLPGSARNELRVAPEMYAIRIDRKPGFTSRPVTGSEQAPISCKRQSLKEGYSGWI